MTRLDEYTKDEWFDIARQFKPDLAKDEYDRMWDDFQAMKAEHLKRKTLN
ncbi:hypothetical protein ACQKIE_16110 [Luteibacter sp. NPDC031894]